MSIDDNYQLFVSRMLSRISGIDSEKCLHADYLKENEPHQYKKVKDAFEQYRELAKTKIKIFDGTKGRSLASLENKIKYYQDKYSPESTFVFIDSFHNMDDILSGGTSKTDGYKAINRASAKVKQMNTDLNVHIMATAHLRKVPAGVIPTKQDLAETGKLEFDALGIMLLYCDLSDLGANAKKFWEDKTETYKNPEWTDADDPKLKYLPMKKPILELYLSKDKRKVIREPIYLKQDPTKNIYTQLTATEIKKYIKSTGEPNPDSLPSFGSHTPRIGGPRAVVKDEDAPF